MIHDDISITISGPNAANNLTTLRLLKDALISKGLTRLSYEVESGDERLPDEIGPGHLEALTKRDTMFHLSTLIDDTP